MARKPMVTRTIKVTQACVLCLDIEQGEPCTKEVTLPRTYKNDEAILKAAKAAVDTDTLKAVSISKSWVEEKLLGMPEDFFIATPWTLFAGSRTQRFPHSPGTLSEPQQSRLFIV